MCLIPPSSLVWGCWLLLGSATAELERAVAILCCPRAGRAEAWTVLESPGVDFFPGCQVKQVGSESHLMLQPFTVTLAT